MEASDKNEGSNKKRIQEVNEKGKEIKIWTMC